MIDKCTNECLTANENISLLIRTLSIYIILVLRTSYLGVINCTGNKPASKGSLLAKAYSYNYVNIMQFTNKLMHL